MAFTKDVRRQMWHAHRAFRGLKALTQQRLAELDRIITANGGEADGGIVAGWTSPEFLAGFKALRDALKNFPG